MKSPFIPVNYARFRRYVTHGVLEVLHDHMRWAEGPITAGQKLYSLYTGSRGLSTV